MLSSQLLAPLVKRARPEAIRAALPPEDQLELDQALAEATDELKATLDLVPPFSGSPAAPPRSTPGTNPGGVPLSAVRTSRDVARLGS